MPPSVTEVLDDLYTTTWQNRRPGLEDNIFTATPFWWYMKEKGKLKGIRGGKWIEEALAYAMNTTVQWIVKGGSVQMNDFKFMTDAIFNWRYLTANVLRYGVDEQQNSGSPKILDWVQQKLDNTEMSLVNTLETALAGGAGAATNQIDGLQFIVPDSANVASATYNLGGIDPSIYTWWQNQAITMSGLSFSVYGIANMRHLLNLCMNNQRMDAPDIIVSDMTSYEYYEDTALPQLRFEDRAFADMGFQSQTYKKIPMIWTPAITARMYMLNTRFLNFYYDTEYFFDMTNWKDIPNQVNDRAAQIITACAFTTNRRRVMGVLDTINTQ